MAAEIDADTLDEVLGAYAGFREIGEIVYEFLPFVTDHRSEVRCRWPRTCSTAPAAVLRMTRRDTSWRRC